MVWFLPVLPGLCDLGHVPENSTVKLLLETHDNVLRAEAGAFMQRCIEEGAAIVVVTQNDDGRTCTVSVERK